MKLFGGLLSLTTTRLHLMWVRIVSRSPSARVNLVHVVPARRPLHCSGLWVLPAFSRFALQSPRRNRALGRKKMGIAKDTRGNYRLTGKTTEQDVLQAAEGILRGKLERQGSIGNPRDATDFLRMRLGSLLHEEFHVMWLDNRHRTHRSTILSGTNLASRRLAPERAARRGEAHG